MKKKWYGPFGRLVKWCYHRVLHPRWRTQEQTEINGPVVYVVHHQNMFGPLHIMGIAPFQARIWALHVFLNRKECFEQFYTYTFTRRYGWAKPPAFLAAGALSLVVPPLLRSFGAIPVFRDTAALVTFRHSLAVLREGESLVICPDDDYTSDGAAMGEMHPGFLRLARMYQNKTGVPLSFVPVCCSAKKKTVVCGAPLPFGATRDFGAEQQRMVAALRNGVNALARQMGDLPPQTAASGQVVDAL